MAGFWDRDIVARCVSMDDFMKIAQVNTGKTSQEGNSYGR